MRQVLALQQVCTRQEVEAQGISTRKSPANIYATRGGWAPGWACKRWFLMLGLMRNVVIGGSEGVMSSHRMIGGVNGYV